MGRPAYNSEPPDLKSLLTFALIAVIFLSLGMIIGIVTVWLITG